MSEVISFRLDKKNLGEAKALLIVQERRSKGYSIRQTITEAITKLDGQQTGTSLSQIHDLNNAINQINGLLEQFNNGDPGQISNYLRRTKKSKLTDHFIVSIRKSSKMVLSIS